MFVAASVGYLRGILHVVMPFVHARQPHKNILLRALRDSQDVHVQKHVTRCVAVFCQIRFYSP